MRAQVRTFITHLLLVLAAIVLGSCVSTKLPFYDSFGSSSTLSQYRKFDERQTDSYLIADGYLKITASENQDLWGGYTGGDRKRGAPLLLVDATSEDFFVEALVVATNTESPGGPQAVNTQVGLFVFLDVNNWMFFGFSNHDFTTNGTREKANGLMTTVTYEGNSIIDHSWDGGIVDTAFLRIEKWGDNWQCKYKINESDAWTIFSDVHIFPMADIKTEAGMGVKTFDLAGSGVSNMGLGWFDKFRVEKR